MRARFGKGSHRLYTQTGLQQPLSEQQPPCGGMRTRSPDMSGVCRTTPATAHRAASQSDGAEPTDWPYSSREDESTPRERR